MARTLGWFSLALGVTELVAPRRLARTLGLEGRSPLIRTYGLREVASGIATLSVDKSVGLASRIVGDALDLATVASAVTSRNDKRGNAVTALVMVVGITLLDLAAYAGVKAAHHRGSSGRHTYADRSGLPRGLAASRGLARKDFATPPDYRAEGTVAAALTGA